MTDRDIENCALSHLVASVVYGWIVQSEECQPLYAGDMSHAWELVEDIVREHRVYPFILMEDRYGGTYSGGKWLCSFGVDMRMYDLPQGDDSTAMDFWQRIPRIISAGATAPRAICLAALRVMEEKKK